MNNDSAKRVLLTVVILIVGGFALYVTGNKIVYQPYVKAKNRLKVLEDDVYEKETTFNRFKIDQANFASWNKMSLPSDFDVAVSQYHGIVKPILETSGLLVENFTDPQPAQAVTGSGSQKKVRHTILPFDVRAKGTAAAVAKALEALQRLPILHRVKTLDLERAESVTLDKEPTGKLNVHMTIEAMIVFGANNTLSLGDAEKQRAIKRPYEQVKERNPFLGPQIEKISKPREIVDSFSGPDVPLFTVLNAISTSPVADNGEREAFLSNRIYDTKFIRLRTAPGFDTFKIFADQDFARPLHRCKVLKIDDREIYYQLGEDVYKMTIYQTLKESMNRSLDAKQLDALGLTSLVDAEFSKVSEAEAAKRPADGGGRKTSGANVGRDFGSGPQSTKTAQPGKGPQNQKGQKGQPNTKQKKDRGA